MPTPVTSADLHRLVGGYVTVCLDGREPRDIMRHATMARGAGDSFRAAVDSVAIDFTAESVSRVFRRRIYMAPRQTDAERSGA